MARCVLDASVTIAALIEEDRSDEARGILHNVISDGAAVPSLWPVEVGNILLLAERHGLTLYDAAYLELSVRRDLPLATFDAALRRAASAAGVQLL